MANPETIRKALQAILTSTARKPVPTKKAKGEGPAPNDSLTPNEAVGVAEPNYNQYQQAAKEASEDARLVDPFDNTSPLDPAYQKGGLTADNNIGQHLIDELDASQAQRNRIGAVEANPNVQKPGPQKIRDASQLETLGRSQDEQRMLDEAARVKFHADQATAKGANNVPERVASSAKQFGKTENINAYVQDVFSRFKEMFDTNALGGARTQGSAASVLRDNFKQLSQDARNIRNPNLKDADVDAILARIVEADNKLTGATNTIDDIKLDWEIGDIPIENSAQSIKRVDDLGEDFTDFIAPNRTDAGVEFSRTYPELSQQRIAQAQQGPQSGNKPLTEVRPNINKFVPNTRGTPPVEGTLSTQDTLLNILRDIQQGNLGPIGQ